MSLETGTHPFMLIFSQDMHMFACRCCRDGHPLSRGSGNVPPGTGPCPPGPIQHREEPCGKGGWCPDGRTSPRGRLPQFVDGEAGGPHGVCQFLHL